MTPLVLVHGNPEIDKVWDPLVHALDREAIRLSPPGFGAPLPEGFEPSPRGVPGVARGRAGGDRRAGRPGRPRLGRRARRQRGDDAPGPPAHVGVGRDRHLPSRLRVARARADLAARARRRGMGPAAAGRAAGPARQGLLVARHGGARRAAGHRGVQPDDGRRDPAALPRGAPAGHGGARPGPGASGGTPRARAAGDQGRRRRHRSAAPRGRGDRRRRRRGRRGRPLVADGTGRIGRRRGRAEGVLGGGPGARRAGGAARRRPRRAERAARTPAPRRTAAVTSPARER